MFQLENGPNINYYRTLRLFAYGTYRQYLENKDQLLDLNVAEKKNVSQSNDTDDAYDDFLITFTRALDVACPFKTKKQHHSKRNTYHNKEALSLRKEFIKAQDKFNLTGRIEDKTDANRKKKAYDLKLRELRKEANADYINQANN
ncbi:COP9 signalosome complex subunit 7b [Homalodisca vitripennis]|nr:COP9 signalosome complex subunit 7b [Homalodisca vitripennis]